MEISEPLSQGWCRAIQNLYSSPAPVGRGSQTVAHTHLPGAFARRGGCGKSDTFPLSMNSSINLLAKYLYVNSFTSNLHTLMQMCLGNNMASHIR